MNSSIIRYILGSVLKLEGALMALPCLVSVIYKEKEGLSYLAVALGCLAFGFLLTFKKPKDTVFYLKEGCVSTALSWIMLSIFGCIPFVLTNEIPSFTNALLRQYPDSPQPEQPYLTMWNRYPIRRCSGEALPTG